MSTAQLQTKKEQNKYEIAAFQTADSLLLPDLFRKIYGDHYLAGEVYDPGHYIRANESGEGISIVARGPDELPVGHVALVTSAPYRGVREVGQGVVDPDCRGGGILNGMIDQAIVLADRDPAVCGLYGASLTNHTFSQRSVWRAEFVDVGFEIGFVPARMMQIEAQAQGPVATCNTCRLATPPGKERSCPPPTATCWCISTTTFACTGTSTGAGRRWTRPPPAG
jgi:hypothetical protein